MRNALVAAMCVIALCASAVRPAHAAQSCDRACQKDEVNQFLDALIAHDPNKAPLAKNVRYTENGQVLELGDGFWGTASATGVYKHYFTDPDSGNVGFFGTMSENGVPVILVARLKIVDRKIAEIETIVSRAAATDVNGQGPAKLDALGKPNPLWDKPIPKSERMSRADLIATANKYFTGLQEDDGKGDYPFTDDCFRLENGGQTSGPSPISLSNPPAKKPASGTMEQIPGWSQMGCKAQFETGLFRFVDRIRDRRFMAIDPMYGTVFVMGFFDHSGTVHDYKLANGKMIKNGGTKEPFTWEMGEAFRVEKHKIRMIEADMTRSPYGMQPNWPEPKQPGE